MAGKKTKISKGASKFISRKIRKIKAEGATQKQAVGKAFGIARHEGFKVPKKGRKK